MIKNSRDFKQVPMLFVEGNVGVGKTTFLKILQQALDVHVFLEPTELWENVDGHNFLKTFFLDQKRWAYSFQQYVLITRIDQMLQADTVWADKVGLVERSIYSGRYCFARVAHAIGTMNDLEWSLYIKQWDRENIRIQRPPAGFIYLRTPADVCFERMAQRGRTAEKTATLDYIKKIETYYDAWFFEKKDIDQDLAQVPVLTLDFAVNILEDIVTQQNYVNQVRRFIETLQG